MIAIVTTLSTLAPHYADSQYELIPLKKYLINTSNIVEMEVYGTTDSKLSYKLNQDNDRSPFAVFTVNETNAVINTADNVSPLSASIQLAIYEGARSFGEAALIATTTNVYFNIEDMVFGESNTANTLTELWINEVGHGVKKVYVNNNVDEIVDKVVTGTTTTSSTSTSSTSTSTSSTSSSSTSSTSTSSTSTSSTSSTSTSSTSTSSTSSSSTTSIA